MSSTRDDVLERERPYSQSLIWGLQRRYFERAGPAAWSTGEVPHYATNNPLLARAYARVVHGFLRDTRLDPGAPLYIVELGAGAGRFAFHFVRAFERLAATTAVPQARWKYVLTDFTHSNVDAWARHAALRSLAERGHVEFCRFDAAAEAPLPFESSNPLIVIANYVFDGLPIDLFEVRPDGLAERVVTTSGPRSIATDPALLRVMRLELGTRPAAPYRDPNLDAILDEYRALPSGTVVAMPVVAIRCLARLADQAGDRLLLLSADKGHHTAADLVGLAAPQPTVHGSFSLPVNYHAIGKFFERRGGRVLAPSAGTEILDTCAFMLDRGATTEHPETRLAFADAIGGGAVEDLHVLRRTLEAQPSLPIETRLALVRAMLHDSTVFAKCLPAFKRAAATASPPIQRELREVARRAFEEHFALDSEPDLAFEVGVLFAECGDWAGAVSFYERSLERCGPDAACLFNLGLAQFHLGQLDQAFSRFGQALALAPHLEEARAMLARTRADLARR